MSDITCGFSGYTFRLFKREPSFFEGVIAMLDFSGDLYNYDKSEKEADLNSLHADWLAVGKDLRNVIDEYAASTKGANNS